MKTIVGRIAVTLVLLVVAGCGAVGTVEFPNSLVSGNGQPIFLHDIEEITNNPNLDNEGIGDLLRELGIEDEELIDALLEL